MLRTTVTRISDVDRLLAWLLRSLCLVMFVVGSNGKSIAAPGDTPTAPANAATAASDSSLAAISMTASPDPVKPGERVLYALTVTNRSANTVNRVDVTASVPDHTTVARGDSAFGSCDFQAVCGPGATLFWQATNLAAGQSQSFTFAALVDAAAPNGTVLHSTATVAFPGQASGGASASNDVAVSAAPPMSLGLVDDPDPIGPGMPLNYTLSFANPSGVMSPASVLSVSLPAGTTFTSASDGGSQVGDTVQWNIDTLPPGASGKRRLNVQTDSAAGSGSIVSASANLGSTQSLARANAVTVVAGTPIAAIVMTAAPDTIKPGERVLYTITVTNRAATNLSRIDVTATVPDHTTVAEGERSFGTCNSQAVCNPGATLFWNANIAVGQSQSFTFAALVDAATPVGTILHGIATVAFIGQTSGGASSISNVVVE